MANRLAATILMCVAMATTSVFGVDVTGKHFDPPRIYLTQASVNRNGDVHALREQVNVLRIIFPGIAGDRDPAGFAWRLEFPDHVEVLPSKGQTIHGSVVSAVFNGAEVRNRCMRNTWGIERLIWYRVADASPAQSVKPIELHLEYKGERIFTDKATLRVHDALVEPAQIDPARFKLWLHYGPYWRRGHYEQTGKLLRSVGINAVQVMAWDMDTVKAADRLGFYVIAQRGGSYHNVHKQMGDMLDQGPVWFDKDDGGKIIKALPYADAVIWDYEPTPALFIDDAKVLARFRKHIGLPDDAPLNEQIVKERHASAWLSFSQDVHAQATRNWAQWSRSLRPDIETIFTEGRCNVFDPAGQIDYRRVAEHVTICDPMNFSGHDAIIGMRKWIAATPSARFAGCQNVAAGKATPVFASANTVMLQTVSAALMGNAGTSVYPGQTMDAEYFVAFNRAMRFLGKHQELIWAGGTPASDLSVTLLPKENNEIRLGDGRVITNVYPDWGRDAIARVFSSPSGDEHLVTVVNWNAAEPCYLRVQLPKGAWRILDDEQREQFTPEAIATLRVDPQDFRGFRIVRRDADAGKDYSSSSLAQIEQDFKDYSGAGEDTDIAGEGPIRFGFDDFNGDNEFEYVVHTPAQQVWISRLGYIVRWQADDALLETGGLGLCRDQLWLPVSERGSAGMDTIVEVRKRAVHDDRAELVVSRQVTLPSLGGMVGVVVTRRIVVAADRPDVDVEVTVRFDSLAMDVPRATISYRVHNHFVYEDEGQSIWIDDGTKLTDLGEARNRSLPVTGLSKAQQDLLFPQYANDPPRRIEAIGQWLPASGTLLCFKPRDPESLLQGLRWLSLNRQQGTIEWMYKPETLRSGESITAAYGMSLYTGIRQFHRKAVQSALPEPVASSDKDSLLFHLDFKNGADAAFAKGDGTAQVTGSLKFEPTPTGRGARITDGVSLIYQPEGNIDLSRGKLMVRFKPTWHGTDDDPHEFLVVRPVAGHLYLARLNDGRFLMNMFEADDTQHYPWVMDRSIQADTWYELVVTWDTAAGLMDLYLDGVKVAEYRGKPWEMPAVANANPRCRLTIPASAESVIDELKIWH